MTVEERMVAEAEALRRYLEAQLTSVQREIDLLGVAHREVHDELQRAVDLSQRTTEERTRVALEAIEGRLEVLNKFRGSLEDSLKNNVNRDLFDIVTNRVTVVENTYVKKADYADDADRLRERIDSELKQRDIRLGELERNSVRQEALDTQTAEVARTRKALAYTIVGGVIIAVLSAWRGLPEIVP